MRLIDADKLAQYLENEIVEDVKVTTGKWEDKQDTFIGAEPVMVCSNCGTHTIKSVYGIVIPMLTCFNYCPVCGSKMYNEEEV